MTRKNFSKKDDIICNMSMECYEDQLSEVQIQSYEKSKEIYDKASITYNALTNNGKVLYENGLISIIYVDSLTKQILPHREGMLLPRFTEEISSYAANDLCSYDQLQQVPDTKSVHSNMVLDKQTDCTLFTGSKQSPMFNCESSVINVPTSASNKGHVNKTDKPLVQIYVDKEIDSVKKKNMFPTLLVEPKPNQSLTKLTINNEFLHLQQNMKILFTLSNAKFTEWLLQQGLIISKQFCSLHGNSKHGQLKMKLDSCKNISNLPPNGGFVWVSECCPHNYISLFKGSLFEGTPHSPAVLIKLLYHWSCQTNVDEITQLLKVNMAYLKTFYTCLRGLCIAAIHEETKALLGGKNKMVEVGVVSLGLLSKEKKNFVKAWILGVMEYDTKAIRMHVIKRDKNHMKKNHMPLQPLMKLVNRNSIILTDIHLDKHLFTNIGYNKVYQYPIHDKRNRKVYSNENILSYLKDNLPRMFGSTLSVLSRPLIQQFLDELSWREKWGATPLQAFNTLTSHISKQTHLNNDQSLSLCLSKIAVNPFMNWQFSSWKTNFKKLCEKGNKMVNTNIQQNYSVVAKPLLVQTTGTEDAMNITIEPIQKSYCTNHKPIQSELTQLECYYYGMLPGNENLLALEKKCTLDMKCVICGVLLKTNICVMEHIICHVFNNNNMCTDSLCKYCLKQFFLYHGRRSINAAKCNENHRKPTLPTLRCLICEQDFKFRTKLILHMHFFHNKSELPYECGICKFRSSQHHIVIDHFYEIHNNGEKIQCPLCLKIVALKNNGFNITQNMYFFVNHLKKHICKHLVRDCNRCVLSFINKGVLEYHQRTYHKSCDLYDVQQYEDNSTIMMPLPADLTAVVKPSYNSKIVDDFLSTKYIHNGFKVVLNINKSYQNALCCECEGFLMEDNHFLGDFACLKCSFKTCCDKSMFEHVVKFHNFCFSENFNENKKVILNSPMYCLCGFQSVIGNELANHLINCGKRSAYKQLEQ